MFRKMVPVLLIAVLFTLPLALIGCQEDEIHTQKTVIVEDKVVDQSEVVE